MECVDTICQVVVAFSAVVATAGYLYGEYWKRVSSWRQALHDGVVPEKTSFWQYLWF